MIADLDETIRQLLINEIPIKNGDIDVKFDQPKREWSAKLTKPTVNFFLYDVRENADLRRGQWQRVPNGNGSSEAYHKKTPMRVDCFYMLTTWAAEPEDEHRLMTRCLMALFRHPFLPEHMLVGTLQEPLFDITARLAVHDRLTNPAEVWGALDNELRPSVPYIVTLALDPWMEVAGPVVRTFSLRTGQTGTLPFLQQLDEGGLASELVFIGGTVRPKGADGRSGSGLTVAIKDSGWVTTTDDSGRFVLGGMPPGDYTLVVWPAKGKPKETAVSIPAGAKTYDLEL